MPLPTNFSNGTQVRDLHPAAHNDTNTAVNDIQTWDRRGTGSPEGVVTAPVGTTYRRTDGGTGTTLYLKETGVGNTGWVPSASAEGGNAGTLDGATKAQLRDRSTHTGTQAADTLTETATAKILTDVERTKLAGIATAATANAADAALRDRSTHTGTQSADTVVDGSTNHVFTAADDTKLTGVATGATANSADATLLARANHTGTQTADSVTDGTTNKAYTATEKTKLAGIATGATLNSADATLVARANHTGTQLASTISNFDAAWQARRRARHIEINWDPGDETTKLGGDEFFTDPAADTATTWTRTVIETSPPNSGSATVSTPRLRVSCPTGLTGGNTRIGLPVEASSSVNDELKSVWLSHTVGSQLGHFHRLGVHPSTGNPMAYAAWMDATFLVDSFFNLNTWENNVSAGTLTQGSANDNGAADLTGLQHWVDVLASSKTGTTVTLTLPRGHGVVVGDGIFVNCTSIYDNSGTVTVVTERTVTYTSSASTAVDVPVGGPGILMDRNTIYPITVKTRLEGTVLRFKAWPHERMDEPSYSTVNNALMFVNTGTNQAVAGESGIIVAHLATDVANVTLGPIEWENLDD
jgi:hypothetical protein